MYRTPATDPTTSEPRPVLLDVRDLRVDYDEFTALQSVSLEVRAGSVVGLVGPNGAGKTTLMRAIAGLLTLAAGTITVCGHDVATSAREAAARVGYMPDLPPLYDDLTVYEFLDLFASAQRIAAPHRRTRIEALVERVKLTEKLGTLTAGLSRGMRQRLFLARTLLHDPPVLLLDEPASGLDPNARAVLADILRGLGDDGHAVLVSSHILSELDEFCHAYAIVERGTLRASGSVGELGGKATAEPVLRIGLAAHDEATVARVTDVLRAFHHAGEPRWTGSTVTVAFDGDEEGRHQLLRALVTADVPVCSYTEAREHIRDVYARITTGETA